MLIETIHQEDIINLNQYASNTEPQNKWRKMTEFKGEMSKSIMKIDRATRQKISKDIKYLKTQPINMI